MEKLKVINEIIDMPNNFLKGNLSVFSLLLNSGYFELYKQISKTDIMSVLSTNQKKIAEWLLFSENKRNHLGWYFKYNEKGMFEVGTLTLNSKTYIAKKTEYIDGVEACSEFIKVEIESIRNTK